MNNSRWSDRIRKEDREEKEVNDWKSDDEGKRKQEENEPRKRRLILRFNDRKGKE